MMTDTVEQGGDSVLPGQGSPGAPINKRGSAGAPERHLRSRHSRSDKSNSDRKGQQRRILGGRLLMGGMPQAQVARAVGVTRKAVSLWNKRLIAEGGLCGLRARPRGRPPGLSEQQREELLRLLMNGALTQGFTTELWTVRRVRHLIEAKFNRRYSESQVHRILIGLGFSSQAPTEKELSRDGAVIRRWKLSDAPGADKA